MSNRAITLLFLAAFATVSAAWANEPTRRAPMEPEGLEYTFTVIEQLSEPDLKEFYLNCSRAATRQRLTGGEIAICSVGYERLLRSTFRGDFFALLEWRRGLGRPAEPVHSPF